MKTKLAILASLVLANFAVAQSPTPAPIVVPAAAIKKITQPVIMTLSPAQLAELAATIKAAVPSFPSGISTLDLQVITTGTNAGGALVRLNFVQ